MNAGKILRSCAFDITLKVQVLSCSAGIRITSLTRLRLVQFGAIGDGNLSQNVQLHGNGQGHGANIRHGLSHLYPGHAKKVRENQNGWDEKQPLARYSHNGGRHSAANGLQHHIARDNPATGTKGYTLEAKRHRAKGDNVRVISENSHQIWGEVEAQYTKGEQK